MIEPTETEAKETLDEFVQAMLEIVREAAEQPELLKEAPHDRPVGRVDEVKAAKRAIVRYLFEDHPDLSDETGAARQLEAQKGA
jgi:glycine dehydrogenase subunit 2